MEKLELIWLGLLILFAIAEALTVGLTSVWFALGALGALITALVGGNIWIQLIVFIILTIISLLTLRPLAKAHLNNKVVPTNADRVIGKEAEVTQAIDNLRGVGAVQIGGIPWTARSVHDTPIPVGTRVRVVRIEGVKVMVEELAHADQPLEEKEEVIC